MAKFADMSTGTFAIKKLARKTSRQAKRCKVSKYAFGPAARKCSGMIHSGIGNLSTREGADIFG